MEHRVGTQLRHQFSCSICAAHSEVSKALQLRRKSPFEVSTALQLQWKSPFEISTAFQLPQKHPAASTPHATLCCSEDSVHILILARTQMRRSKHAWHSRAQSAHMLLSIAAALFTWGIYGLGSKCLLPTRLQCSVLTRTCPRWLVVILSRCQCPPASRLVTMLLQSLTKGCSTSFCLSVALDHVDLAYFEIKIPMLHLPSWDASLGSTRQNPSFFCSRILLQDGSDESIQSHHDHHLRQP